MRNRTRKKNLKSTILKSVFNTSRDESLYSLPAMGIMDSIQGIGAAAGITIGKIQVIRQATLLLNAAEQSDPEHEWQRMLAAQQHSLQTMSGYHEQAQQRYSPEMAKIYKAYRLMLQDEVYLDNIKQHIDAGQRAERSIILETERLCCNLNKHTSAYLAQLAEDIRVIQHMLLATLSSADDKVSHVPQDARIIIADEMTPADTLVYTPEQLKGFVTCGGGITSHSVILVKELGISAIVGAEMELASLVDEQLAIVDADRDRLYIDPDDECLARYRQLIEAHRSKRRYKAVCHDQLP